MLQCYNSMFHFETEEIFVLLPPELEILTRCQKQKHIRLTQTQGANIRAKDPEQPWGAVNYPAPATIDVKII